MTELETSPLRRLTSALSSAVSSDEVAVAILQDGLLELGALVVSLWLIDNESASLVYAGGAGEVPMGVERFASIPLGADLPGTVVASTREPIVYRSSSERNRRWPALASIPSTTEASVVLPLEARNEAIGCLSVGFADERNIDGEELAQLLTAADQCALALDRAQLLDRERRARQTLEFLAEATRLMVSALDPIDVLDQLLNHAVPLMADWCGVFVHEDGLLRRTVTKIAGEPRLAERIVAEAPALAVTSHVPIARAWRTGTEEHIAVPSRELLDELFGATAGDVERLGWRDVVVCPIVARGNRVGVITFAFTSSNRRYTSELGLAATGLAARAGVALGVAERFERERTTAATLVAAVLPERLPVVDGWSIVARYLPSGDAVCGDWYDVSPLPDGRLLVGVGDAAGHGLAAATLMAELRNAARGIAFAGHEPAELLAGLSALAAQNGADSFATAAYGRLDPVSGSGSWAAAGHLPLLLLPVDGPPRYVDTPVSPPLGIEGTATDRRIDLRPGDTLLLYTDGLVERRHEVIDRGLARLESAAAGPVHDTAELADRIVAELCEDLADDCCLLILHRNAEQSDDSSMQRVTKSRSTMSTVAAPNSASAFCHEALFYAGQDQFLDATVPFIVDGLERDELVFVVVNAPKIDALRHALGGAADDVQFADMAQIGRNPARIIPAWRDFVNANGRGDRRLRGIGEPISADRSGAALVECHRHESLLNLEFADSGDWWLLCPYDTASLPADVLAEAGRTHPFVLEGGQHRSSPSARDLSDVGASFEDPLPEPPAGTTAYVFDASGLTMVRRLVRDIGARARLGATRTTDLVLAADEVATNSIRHGGGRGTLRVWLSDHSVVCDVRDSGELHDPMVGRRRPPPDEIGSRGLWLANQLCELVQIRSSPAGMIVRLHVERA